MEVAVASVVAEVVPSDPSFAFVHLASLIFAVRRQVGHFETFD